MHLRFVTWVAENLRLCGCEPVSLRSPMMMMMAVSAPYTTVVQESTEGCDGMNVAH